MCDNMETEHKSGAKSEQSPPRTGAANFTLLKCTSGRVLGAGIAATEYEHCGKQLSPGWDRKRAALKSTVRIILFVSATQHDGGRKALAPN